MLHYTLERLRDEHTWLDQELAVARRAARPAPQRITTLKKRKLVFKSAWRFSGPSGRLSIEPGPGRSPAPARSPSFRKQPWTS